MSITAYPNGVSSFGIPVVGGQGVPFGGNVYFLDPTNGNDGFSGTTPKQAVKTLPVAYALLTANQNDVLYYIAGTSSISLAAEFDWAKSYTHFVGVCAGAMTGQRARIFATAGNLDLDPLITISGTGCVWSNIRVFLGVDDAQALTAVKVTGNYNHFYNCHFAGAGHATCAVDGASSLLVDGGSENTFTHCAFGVTTIDAATGVRVLAFDSLAKRNVFEDCIFTLRAGDTAAMLVELVDATGVEDYTLFRRCLFLHTSANQAVSLASAFVVPAGTATFARMFLQDCMGGGFAKWDANDRGIVFGNMNAVTGADLSGVAVEIKT